MSILREGASVRYKMLHNGNPLKKGYHVTPNSSVEIWSAGNIVTYNVDGTTYKEEVDYGATCLSPKTFTPSKSGWTFVGWREDASASSSVLTSKVMDDNPITLYAVFTQVITVTYYDNTTTAKSTKGNRYYNTGNVANPSFTLHQAIKSGWSPVGWATSNAGNAEIAYNNATAFTRDSNVILYGRYNATITLSYNGNSATGGSVAAQNGTVCYNSSGNVVGHTFTLAANGFARTYHKWTAWALSSATGTQYAAGSTITLTASATMYAVWLYTGKPYTITRTDLDTKYRHTLVLDCYDSNDEYDSGIDIHGDYGIRVFAGDDRATYSVSGFPTQGCNRVRITYYTSGILANDSTMNGKYLAVDAVDEYLYFDCSGDTFAISGTLNSAGDGSHLHINELYFYSE